MKAILDLSFWERIKPGVSVFGVRIHDVSGGYVGNGGMNVNGTATPGSVFNSVSVPPYGMMSVSSNPFSTEWRWPVMAGSSPAFGPSTFARNSGLNRRFLAGIHRSRDC